MPVAFVIRTAVQPESLVPAVREAVRRIEEGGGPWFVYVPFHAVHTPVDAPEAQAAVRSPQPSAAPFAPLEQNFLQQVWAQKLRPLSVSHPD